VPGVQLDARIADDPAGEARILIRLPDQWNGKLVVAGASGTRSEFNGDFAWSDYVVQKGYAYVSQNKGVLNFSVAAPNSSTPPEPLACRLNPTSTLWVHFYANDPATPFTRWTPFMIEATRIGGNALSSHYGSRPHRTYAVGTSNGGYQVRRAIETAPELYDGGVDWEGTYVDPVAPNVLSGPRQFSILRTTPPPALTPTAQRRKTSSQQATRLISYQGRARSGASIRPNSGRSPYASGRSGSTRAMTPTDRAPTQRREAKLPPG